MPLSAPRTSAIALLAIVFGLAAPALAAAAFPGEPGPIAYLKYDNSPLPPDYFVEPRGGLVAHGPRQQQPTRQLTDDAGDHAPAYSPDGRLIAFDGSRGATGFGRQLYLMDADGTDIRQLTSGAIDSEPAFSADGRQLVFARSEPERGIAHLMALTLASGQVRQLTFGDHEDREPVVAPNGQRILFASDRDADGGHDRTDIFEVGLWGRGLRALVNGPGAESSPDVAPYGNRLAYVVEKGIFRTGALRLSRRNGSRPRALGEPGPECNPCYREPTFSPTGRHLAAIEVRRPGTSLYVLRTDGERRRQFDTGIVEVDGYGGHVEGPAWGVRAG